MRKLKMGGENSEREAAHWEGKKKKQQKIRAMLKLRRGGKNSKRDAAHWEMGVGWGKKKTEPKTQPGRIITKIRKKCIDAPTICGRCFEIFKKTPGCFSRKFV